jgi:hypothetical protein
LVVSVNWVQATVLVEPDIIGSALRQAKKKAAKDEAQPQPIARAEVEIWKFSLTTAHLRLRSPLSMADETG